MFCEAVQRAIHTSLLNEKVPEFLEEVIGLMCDEIGDAWPTEVTAESWNGSAFDLSIDINNVGKDRLEAFRLMAEELKREINPLSPTATKVEVKITTYSVSGRFRTDPESE